MTHEQDRQGGEVRCGPNGRYYRPALYLVKHGYMTMHDDLFCTTQKGRQELKERENQLK